MDLTPYACDSISSICSYRHNQPFIACAFDSDPDRSCTRAYSLRLSITFAQCPPLPASSTLNNASSFWCLFTSRIGFDPSFGCPLRSYSTPLTAFVTLRFASQPLGIGTIILKNGFLSALSYFTWTSAFSDSVWHSHHGDRFTAATSIVPPFAALAPSSLRWTRFTAFTTLWTPNFLLHWGLMEESSEGLG